MSGKTVAKLMEKDPEFLAKFVVAPKSAMSEFGIETEALSNDEVRALETLAEQSQDNMRTNAKLIGVQLAAADWGIGAGCCSSTTAAFSTFARSARRR